MAIEPRSILKTFFITGHVPTQDEYWDVLDSYIHQVDDNLTIYLEPGDTQKRLGIGTLEPDAPLGITAVGVNSNLAAFNKEGEGDASWFINLKPGIDPTIITPGLNIDQVVGTGKVSRLFIEEETGDIGIGTTTPDQKLHIQKSSGGGVTGVRILNTATAINNGFIIGHDNNPVDEQDGSLTIFENTAIDANNRFTIRAGGRVGINEPVPDTKLHVSADVDNAEVDIDLFAGTGIVTIGPMTSNIVADYRGIQARTGEYDINGVLSLEASELNLQRLGGNILIHGDMDIDDSSKILITDDGRIGVGTLTPGESIHTAGAIILGDSIGAAEGTIRFTGDDFEGFKDGDWYSLTGSAPPPPFTPWTQGPGNSIYYLAASDSRAGIGTNSPDATLDIDDGESVTAGNSAAVIYNHALTSGTAATDYRIGLEVKNNGPWNDLGQNIGLYISDVSGVTANEGNIAAVLNNNVVIGDITGTQFLGPNANRVLAILNGTAPDVFSSGTPATSVQIYSQNFTPAVGAPAVPTLHVMRNGDVVKLYRAQGLTASASNPISPDVYGTDEATVLGNLRDRLDALEARLIEIGLLNNPV